MATLLTVVESIVVSKHLYKRLPYATAWVGHLTVVIATIMVALLTVDAGNRMIFSATDVGSTWRASWYFLFSPLGLSLLAYSVVLTGLLNFFRQLGRRFGHSFILDVVHDDYAHEKEEYRTFMFLDLDYSTTLAETMGHMKYSRLLNQCFNDLSDLLLSYEADVYQYVGDAVILTWPTVEGQQQDEVADLYFAFREKLCRRAPFYQRTFGVVPTFKASVHSGMVSITRVGRHRKELAYHGDVLNTAARLLGMSSQLQKNLLVTSSVAKNISQHRLYEIHPVDTLLLRGKRKTTEVLEVTQRERPCWSPDKLPALPVGLTA